MANQRLQWAQWTGSKYSGTWHVIKDVRRNEYETVCGRVRGYPDDITDVMPDGFMCGTCSDMPVRVEVVVPGRKRNILAAVLAVIAAFIAGRMSRAG